MLLASAGLALLRIPVSPRPELAWSDWSAPIDGLEWLNADSEWRDEGRWATDARVARLSLTAARRACLASRSPRRDA